MKGVIGDRLRAALRESDLTQDQVAAKIGIDRSCVSRFLMGKSWLGERSAEALADLLKLELVPRSEASTARDVPRQPIKTAHK